MQIRAFTQWGYPFISVIMFSHGGILWIYEVNGVVDSYFCLQTKD